jgi:hypothetical protein
MTHVFHATTPKVPCPGVALTPMPLVVEVAEYKMKRILLYTKPFIKKLVKLKRLVLVKAY